MRTTLSLKNSNSAIDFPFKLSKPSSVSFMIVIHMGIQGGSYVPAERRTKLVVALAAWAGVMANTASFTRKNGPAMCPTLQNMYTYIYIYMCNTWAPNPKGPCSHTKVSPKLGLALHAPCPECRQGINSIGLKVLALFKPF